MSEVNTLLRTLESVQDSKLMLQFIKVNLKSYNLQYKTLVRWADGTNDSSTKHLMFQMLFFFHKILKIFQFIYKSIRNYEKKNIWNVRRLVDESFVPSAQRTSVLFCRLSDFTSCVELSKGSAHC